LDYNKENVKRKYIMWADGDEIKVMDLGKDWHTKIPTQAMVRVDMSKVYANDRERLVQSVCDILKRDLCDFKHNDLISNFDAGYEAGIKRAMKILREQGGFEDGRKGKERNQESFNR
jgi:hypothetical protein